MNPILLIPKFNQTQPIKEENQNKFGVPRLNVLQKDTFSFGATHRRKKTGIANLPDMARTVVRTHEQEARTNFREFCNRLFLGYQEGLDYTLRLKSDFKVQNKTIRGAKDLDSIDINQVREITTDLAGARLVTDGLDGATEKVIGRLIEEIKAGNVKITEIRNYHGVWKPDNLNSKVENIQPYLSKDPMNALSDAQREHLRDLGKPSDMKLYEGAGKESAGYTSVHILGKTTQGLPFEIQIKGNHVKKIDDATHILHDIDIAKKAAEKAGTDPAKIDVRTIMEYSPEIKKMSSANRELLRPVIEVYLAISAKGLRLRKIYDKYIFECYRAAREAETHVQSAFKFPEFPKVLRNPIQLEKLFKIAKTLHLT